jgi:hypothetical protein
MGKERDAGCDFSMGISKREKAAMPPEAIKAVAILRIWMDCVADMLVVEYFSVKRGRSYERLFLL